MLFGVEKQATMELLRFFAGSIARMVRDSGELRTGFAITALLCCAKRGHPHMRTSVFTALVLVLAAAAAGQEGPRTIDPREFGLDLPAGAVAPGDRLAVLTNDDNGQPAV